MEFCVLSNEQSIVFFLLYFSKYLISASLSYRIFTYCVSQGAVPDTKKRITWAFPAFGALVCFYMPLLVFAIFAITWLDALLAFLCVRALGGHCLTEAQLMKIST